MAERKKITVIGSGLGGLSAAINLSDKFELHVFEKNSYPGGKAGEIRNGQFRFDSGPSLLTIPAILKDIFKARGENIDEYLAIKPLENLCRYFYLDGTIVNGYSSLEKFAKEIENKTSESAISVKKYFDYSKKIYDITSDIFLYKSLNEFRTYSNFETIKSILNLPKIDAFRNVHESNSNFFSDTKVVQLFDRYATYSGSNPYQAPATLNIIPYVEYVLGGYIAEGGIYAVVNALYKLAEKNGVTFHFNSSVKKIISENRKVSGINYANQNMEEKLFNAEVVISNADAQFTKENLLNLRDNYAPEASSSAIVFYWGVEGNYPELDIHNILFSENYKKEFEDIFNEKKVPDDPTIYIYISSKFNKTDAPSGCENWFVMINTPYDSGQKWTDEILTTKKKIIRKIKESLNIDLSGKIKTESYLTPYILSSKTNSYKGSIYGISSNSRKAAFIRQRNKSNKYKGLYYCGGSAHPGGGIPLVLQSGKIVSQLINKYEL